MHINVMSNIEFASKRSRWV